MPSAFDRTVPRDDHSPLANQLDFAPGKQPFTVDAILDAWLNSFNEFIIPIIKEITGLDLSSPGAFFVSLVDMITTGTTQALMFVQAILQPLVDAIIAVLGPIPIIGGVVQTLANFLGLTKNVADTAQVTGEAAQVAADTANVGVARLEGQLASGNVPNGVLFDDTFARSGADLGTDYIQTNSGPAGGTLSTDGNNAVLVPTGAGQTYGYGRIVTPLFTDYQAISVVQDSPFQNILSSGEWEISLRCNAAQTERVVARITLNTCAIGKVVGGSYTQLSSVTQGNTTGDRWTLKVGTTTDIREIELYYGTASTPLIHAIDNSGTLSSVGASNRFAMIGQWSSLYYVPPFFTGQQPPPRMQSVTAYDRLAAA